MFPRELKEAPSLRGLHSINNCDWTSHQACQSLVVDRNEGITCETDSVNWSNSKLALYGLTGDKSRHFMQSCGNCFENSMVNYEHFLLGK